MMRLKSQFRIKDYTQIFKLLIKDYTQIFKLLIKDYTQIFKLLKRVLKGYLAKFPFLVDRVFSYFTV